MYQFIQTYLFELGRTHSTERQRAAFTRLRLHEFELSLCGFELVPQLVEAGQRELCRGTVARGMGRVGDAARVARVGRKVAVRAPRCTYSAVPSAWRVCRRSRTKVEPSACSSLLLAVTPSDQSTSTSDAASAGSAAGGANIAKGRPVPRVARAHHPQSSTEGILRASTGIKYRRVQRITSNKR